MNKTNTETTVGSEVSENTENSIIYFIDKIIEELNEYKDNFNSDNYHYDDNLFSIKETDFKYNLVLSMYTWFYKIFTYASVQEKREIFLADVLETMETYYDFTNEFFVWENLSKLEKGIAYEFVNKTSHEIKNLEKLFKELSEDKFRVPTMQDYFVHLSKRA